MRKALRFYVITHDGAIRRLPVLTFERIIQRHAKAPFADMVGKRVRYVQLLVQMENRKAVAIRRAYFGYLTFDHDGIFDPSEWEQPFETVGDRWGSFIKPEEPPAGDEITRFANRSRAHEYGWQPTAELRRALTAKVTRGRRRD